VIPAVFGASTGFVVVVVTAVVALSTDFVVVVVQEENINIMNRILEHASTLKQYFLILTIEYLLIKIIIKLANIIK
jgi:hypothetical protein